MMQNLDFECAELGRRLAKIRNGQEQADETVFTRALGVLEEQGLYACFLYLRAREGSVGAGVACQAVEFLRRLLGQQVSDNKSLQSQQVQQSQKKRDEPQNVSDEFQLLQNLASELDKLLFARDLLRQAFVYARYHAKTREGRRGGKET